MHLHLFYTLLQTFYTPLQCHYFLIFVAHWHLTTIAQAHTQPTREHKRIGFIYTALQGCYFLIL